ncbi:hypothetical protein STCU_11177 [Strigomonas culicis]|uniref:Uncharacterized protein n=1 Tax=Strigomonas culicis TaxID=28005 RepID=S9V137_9TRYP|nr:hypothetical protein STCU_11177 [Strigomonas culicis]|eukprot:EPY16515.1 hypothetical protein STCU_11177 [Strigomonas culicis]
MARLYGRIIYYKPQPSQQQHTNTNSFEGCTLILPEHLLPSLHLGSLATGPAGPQSNLLFLHKPFFLFPSLRLVLAAYTITSYALLQQEKESAVRTERRQRQRPPPPTGGAPRETCDVAVDGSQLLACMTPPTRATTAAMYVPSATKSLPPTPFKNSFYDPFGALPEYSYPPHATDPTDEEVVEDGEDGQTADAAPLDTVGLGFERGPDSGWYVAPDILFSIYSSMNEKRDTMNP